jgi:polyphenol oxidase
MHLENEAPGVYRFNDTHPFEIGTAGKMLNGIDYERESGAVRMDEKAVLRKLTGVDEARIIMLEQAHGDTIIQVSEPPGKNEPVYGQADGLITDREGICLVIRTADCVPVFAMDPRKMVLGAAHSGWRGCRLGIAGKLVSAMAGTYGCDPATVRVCILPSIGPRSYEVSADVAAHFPGETLRRGSALYLDLWKSVERALIHAGVPPDNVYTAGICTMEARADFYSHRNGEKGRNLNFGFIR